MTQQQYEPALVQEVLHMLTSHGLVILAVDPEKGEVHVKIPRL